MSKSWLFHEQWGKKKRYKIDPFANTHIENFKSSLKILNCICRLQLILLHCVSLYSIRGGQNHKATFKASFCALISSSTLCSSAVLSPTTVYLSCCPVCTWKQCGENAPVWSIQGCAELGANSPLHLLQRHSLTLLSSSYGIAQICCSELVASRSQLMHIGFNKDWA